MADKCLVRVEKLLKKSSITAAKKEEIINYLKKYDYELIDCKKIKSLTMFSNLFAEDCYFKKKFKRY